MDDEHQDDEVVFELDTDEAQHLQSVPQKYIDLLRLTNEGAVLCDVMAAESCEGLSITNRQMILSILVLKIVEQIRTAIRSILLGHYSAVPVLLRSVLDSISVLLLVGNNEHQFKIWIFLSYIEQERLEADKDMVKTLRNDFASAARLAYENLLSDDSHLIPDDPRLKPVSSLIIEFNAHVHPDIFGIFERARVQVSLEEILGLSVKQALAISRGDPIEALKIIDFKEKSQFRDNVSQATNMETSIFGLGIIEEALVDHYSEVIHAATHHLFDIVKKFFGEGCSGSLRKQGCKWHELSMKEFD